MSAPRERKIDSEQIFTVLRDEILTGQHPAGTPFKEIPLAERFGVSRTPIRSALTRLQQEQLLVRRDRGLEIPRTDPARVIQVYDLRVTLEATAAAEAARSHQLTELLRLEGLLARDRALVNPTEHQMLSTNLEFHEAIWAATHNPVLIDLLERLGSHLIHSPRPTLAVDNRWESSLGEHAELLAAIESRDADLAHELARGHMETAKRIRLQLLKESAINSI
ncbi:GntR family transcriptional regulator [Corynebacterium nasicanis]|uniref:GntR family transcriptional regulator n=1 Tax=Corynebacterium nasicanis TaxID=1448267 RepID=A0ABW1QA99_9CORY